MLQRLACLLLIVCVFFSCKDEDPTPTVDAAITQLDVIDELIEQAEDKNKSKEEKKKLLREVDSLVSKLPDDSNKILKHRKLGIIYYYLEDYVNFKAISDRALDLSISIGDSLGIAKSYLNLGIYYRNFRNYTIAYKNFYQAEKICSLINKNNDVCFTHGNILVNLAQIKRRAKDYSKSETYTIAAIKQFHLSGNKEYIPLCYSNLGSVAKYLGRYDEAIAYHKKAMEFDGSSEKKQRILISLNNIGVTYKSQQKYDQAKEAFHKALSYKDFLKKDRRRYALLTDNLAYAKFLSNDLENIPELFYEALRVRDSIQNKTGLSTNNLHLAEYYQSIGDFKRAKSFAVTARKLAKEIGNNEELLKSYQILSKVSNPKEGLQYAEAYIQLNDSLVKEERLFRDKIARIQFETEEKEQQIVEKEAQIVQKEQQIATVQNQNTIYLLGILLLLMGISFAIYFFRQRTKYLAQQNQMVQFQASYETETRISKRLHDELGNDIFQVMLQYQNDPHDSKILERLNATYAKARDISRENNEFDVDESFSEELSDMLKNYTKNGIQLLVRGLDKINWQGFEAPVKITVYRVLQELMTNMQKHSQAGRVVLVFTQDNNTLHIKYTDNGVGIDKTQLQSKNGLHNTEKRIRAIDGTLIFESEKEKGFKANISIPN
ncbi:tetratricopeptide repeat-containing sensor histidine kinase [Aquimarina spongiae]|uniref:histidine kinase n=1 Tax=Aquimarina spongiae TaxID=570521 RepID=A0A1M6JL32_9FLAO|nr:tetratricopeptide repeat-containing sensor histidine kinase [Aquimarina spongiae]SHJ47409.1 Histidine kinase-, DNA gyrase B-, and HSP90-like ATPase [Aquimarina spongiae]